MIYLDVRDVTKSYISRGGVEIQALRGVSLHVDRGETLGIMGESGCGKSTLARVIARLEAPTGGNVFVEGVDIGSIEGRALQRHRKVVQMVFQDPASSLSPRQRVGDALGEVLAVHGVEKAEARLRELFDLVGLPAGLRQRFPHQLSGGQQQRVAIARALAVEPQVLVLDEAVSALDVSVRAQIMNLLTDLRSQLNLTYVFISHDWEMIRHISDRIAVMYLGRIVELGPWDAVSRDALHPYTKALRMAVPIRDPSEARRLQIQPLDGEIPSPANPPAGCSFHPRCPIALEECGELTPQLRAHGSKGQSVSCLAVSPEKV